MLKISILLLFVLCGVAHGASPLPRCPGKAVESTIDTRPLVGMHVARVPRYFPGDAHGGFSMKAPMRGFAVDPASGTVFLSEPVLLTALHGKEIALLVTESSQGNSCVHRVILRVRSADIAVWEDRGAFVLADFRKNEYMVDGRFFDDELSFRSFVGGSYSRSGLKRVLNAGRKPLMFSENELPRSDRGLLLEGGRRQLLRSPEAPVSQEVNLAPGSYVLQMWGRGNVSVSGATTGVAREGEPLRFVMGKSGRLMVAPEGSVAGDPAGPLVRRFQLTEGGAPTSFISGTERGADRLSYRFNVGKHASDAFWAVFDLDLPALGEDHAIFLKSRLADDASVALVFSSEGAIEAQLRIRERLVASVSVADYKKFFGKRGSRVAVGVKPGRRGVLSLYVDEAVVGQREFSGDFLLSDVVFWDADSGKGSLPLEGYLKKMAFMRYVEPGQLARVLDAADWRLAETHALLADVPLKDPLIVDLEEMPADAVFPAVNPRTGELDFGISWTKSFPVVKRDVLVVGARTKVRQVRNVFGQRGNESAFQFPVSDAERVDTDVVNSQGVVWEIGGYKNTRSVFHNALSGVRAGIHRDMNPLPELPVDWRYVTRNDPHQTRLHWNARALYKGVHDYYIDLVTESVSGTVEGYHGDAGMQWQTASTDGKSSPIGTVAAYSGHFNVSFTTHYAGFYLPVQYLAKDQSINENAPLPEWLKIERVQGKMLSEFREYENARSEDVKSSPGNVTSAFYHLDLSSGNRFGSYRPFPVYLKDFYVEPFPGRALLDHVRPLNGKPILQHVSNDRETLHDVDGIADAGGNVSFPEVTQIRGRIFSGSPKRDFSSTSREYGPGPWYWPRFEGMIY